MFAYIPARAGSKRLKNKNILPINGTPLLEIVIKKLKKLDFLENIFVSTDCKKIKQIAEKAGAECLDLRKKKLSGDKVSFIDLIKNDIPRYAKNYQNKDVLFVLATAVLVNKKVLKEAYDVFRKKKPEILISCEQAQHPPWWAMRLKKSGFLEPIFKDKVSINSQYLEQTFFDSGMFYYFDLDSLKKYESHKLAKKILPFFLDFENRADLNNSDDLKLLKIKYSEFYND